MIEGIASQLSPEAVAILLAVGIYVAKELKDFFIHTIFKAKDKTEENTQAVRDLIHNIKALSDRLIAMEVTLDKALKEFSDSKAVVWKLERDVSFAHEKIRDLKDQSR